jgi:hypothetical protein
MPRVLWKHLQLALVLTLLLVSPALGCPNCKEAVSAQPEDVANMARGFNWSIMLMLGVPATLLGTGGFMVHRAMKNGTLPEM